MRENRPYGSEGGGTELNRSPRPPIQSQFEIALAAIAAW